MQIQTVKMVITGPFNSGKTAFGLLLSAGYRWGRTPPPQR